MINNSVINVLVAYDQELLGDGLAALLSRPKDVHVSGLIKNDLCWKKNMTEYDADILVIEFARFQTQQMEYIKQISDAFPNMKILIISEIIPHKLLDELLHYIHGYVLRNCTSEKFLYAVHEIYNAGRYICAKAIDAIFCCSNSPEVKFDLTFREKEILASWLTSKDNKELADQLNISHSTVRTHLKNIRQKLGTLSHIEFMNYACRENLLQGNFKPVCKNCRLYCHG